MVVRVRALNSLKQVLLHVVSCVIGALSLHEVDSNSLLSLLSTHLFRLELIVRVKRVILLLNGFTVLTGGVFVDRVYSGKIIHI